MHDFVSMHAFGYYLFLYLRDRRAADLMFHAYINTNWLDYKD